MAKMQVVFLPVLLLSVNIKECSGKRSCFHEWVKGSSTLAVRADSAEHLRELEHPIT